MKITDLRTLLLRTPLAAPTKLPVGTWTDHRNLLVIVETDDGVAGTGEIWINFPAWSGLDRTFVVSDVLKPILVGEPLDDPTRLFRKMEDATRALARRWHAPGPVSHAIAGVDIALWDAFARSQNKTLRSAISSAARNSVDVYASSFGPGPVARDLERSIDCGHTRLKLRLVSGPEQDRRILREAREVAADLPLMADPAETYTPRTLQLIWDAILEAKLCWLEEPFPSDDASAYAEYRTWPGRPPLALGESNYGTCGLKHLMERFQPDIVQPDLTKTGGISQGLGFATQVSAAGKQFVPHMLGGPIGFMVSANLVAACEEAGLCEMDFRNHPTFEEFYGGFPRVVEGRVQLPEEPGHGARVDEERLRKWIG